MKTLEVLNAGSTEVTGTRRARKVADSRTFHNKTQIRRNGNVA